MKKKEEKKVTKPVAKKETAKKVETKKAEPKKKAAPVKKAEPKKKAEAVKESSTKTYHISQTEDGKWKVKGAKGEKALKLFKTQAEAIKYADGVAKNQEGSIRIHSRKGKIRKA